MFGLTKKNPQNQVAPKSDAMPNPSQSDSFNIDEVSIHTMQDDLKNLKNPNASHDIIMAEEKNIPVSQPAPSQRQSNSPFLNLADKNPLSGLIASDEKPLPPLPKENIPPRTDSIDRPSPFSIPQKQKSFATPDPIDITNFESTPSMTKDRAVFRYNWRMIFFSALSLFLIITLSWIGYHYSQDKTYNPFKQKPAPIVTEPIRPEEPKEPIKGPASKPILSYSEVNPNYLRLEDPALDAEKIKTALKQHLDKIYQEKYSAPIEFVITDPTNKAIGFKAFSALLGLKFSPALMALLGENFNLYIYNDVTAPKIGIAIESKDDINLAKVLLSEEKKLADEISPIFFTKEYRTEKEFAGSEYSAVKVRYQNVISPDTLSVDYAVHKNKLLIGTTKLTLRTIIDKLNGITIPEKGLEPEPVPTELKKN